MNPFEKHLGTSSIGDTPSVTIETIKEVMAKMPEEPLAKFMRSKGFYPEKGDKMILPTRLGQYFSGRRLPDYVMVSSGVSEPVLIRSSI